MVHDPARVQVGKRGIGPDVAGRGAPIETDAVAQLWDVVDTRDHVDRLQLLQLFGCLELHEPALHLRLLPSDAESFLIRGGLGVPSHHGGQDRLSGANTQKARVTK